MNKYYVCDVGLRNMLVRGKDTDAGHILENLVYLELRRRYPEVYVGQIGPDGEVDFVAMENGEPRYFQVAQTVLDENVLDRELKPLRKIKDNYPKYLLTLDEVFDDLALGVQLADSVRNLDPGGIPHIDVQKNQVIGGLLHGLEKSGSLRKCMDIHMYAVFTAIACQVIVQSFDVAAGIIYQCCCHVGPPE